MRRFSGATIAALIGLVAVVAPIVISLELSWKEALGNESALTLGYARDVLRRTDEMAQQMRKGMAQIQNAHFPPCSPPEIDLMRQIDVGSNYLQALGRLQGDTIVCTSLGTTTPIAVGPPDLITANGAAERLHAHIPLAGNHPLLLFSENGVVFLVDPALAIDTPTEGASISIAIFVPSSPGHTIIAERNNNLRPEWFQNIPKGASKTFRSAGSVVAILRSAHTDVAVVAAAPESYVVNRVQHFAAIFVPLGLLCAVVLAWAVARISRVRLSLPAVLRAAARRREFFVEYQPIVDLATRRWIGAEALVRWRRADGRVIRPDNFIPIAEESGVITLIARCVVEIVAADLPGLVKIDPGFFVSINLSAPDLGSAETLGLLKRVIDTGGIGSANLKVEATERSFLQDKPAREILDEIRALGISVAIDDFGTGYSSLSCLESLGLDALKIDKAFVETIGTDGATSGVVPHIIGMAQSLKLTMVAEGVETEAQAEFLRRRGVQHAQGWLFGKPMKIELLRDGLKSQPACPVEAEMERSHWGASD